MDVRLILPHISGNALVQEMARSHYQRLLDAGVKIYEYRPGFVHAKCYLADDEYAMVGSINLDHRSLVHHFENGVWMYRCSCIRDIQADFEDTLEKYTRAPGRLPQCAKAAGLSPPVYPGADPLEAGRDPQPM